MKINRKVFVMLIAVMMAALLLASCGKEDEPSGSDDPNLGLWQATTVEVFDEEYPAEEIYQDGFEIELLKDGKCKFRAEGKEDKYDWSIEEDTLSISSGGNVFITALINGNEMVIDDFMSMGIKITLQKEGTASQNGALDNDPDQTETAENGSAELTDPIVENDTDSGFISSELKEIYQTLSQDYDNSELQGMSYQEICDTYFGGAEGVLDFEGETITIYKWIAGDNPSDYVQVSFQDYDESGERTAGGIGSEFE